MPSAAPDEQERRWPRAGGSRALAERGRQGARRGQEWSLAMPERSGGRRYVPPAGRSMHAHMTLRERGAGRSTRGHADEEQGKEEVCRRSAAALQMMARSEAWAGALATPVGGGRDLEKAGEREREEQCLL